MKKNSIQLIIAISLFILLTHSCGKDDYSILYEFTAVEAVHAENTGELPLTTDLDSIPANAYVLRLNLFPIEISTGHMLPDDPGYPPQNINWIDSILIVSSSDFDSSHLSGTSLNDKFILFNHSYLETRTLDNFIVQNFYAADFKDNPMPEYADLLLIDIPDISNAHVFTVTLYLKDGAVFIDSTSSITLF